MSLEPSPNELIERYLVGAADTADTADIDRLQRALQGSAEVARAFAKAVLFDAWLEDAFSDATDAIDLDLLIEPFLENTEADVANSAAARTSKYASSNAHRNAASNTIPPIVVDPSTSFHPLAGNYLLSYSLGAVLLGVLILISWTWKIPYDRKQELAVVPTNGVKRDVPLACPQVGRITGLLDCRWANPRTTISIGDNVLLGQKYVLKSGFLEVAYDTGAKVVLKGPCVYRVESKTSGYLSLGKLTARISKKEGCTDHGPGAKGERTANLANAQSASEPTTSLAPRPSIISPLSSGMGGGGEGGPDSQLSTLNSGLFSVRTPTAVVADLGTEFGVEVDRSGASRAHVFQGKIKFQPAAGGRATGNSVVLQQDEWAATVAGQSGGIAVVRGTGRTDQHVFMRRMPRWVTFNIYGTGVGLKEGDADPRWQIVARSDDPHFVPRPAVVTAVDPRMFDTKDRPKLPLFGPNDPAQSQWISLSNGPPLLPGGVVFTFRTTFRLVGVLPSTAELGGRFFAYDSVTAIRVNGVKVASPKYDAVRGSFDSFNTHAKQPFVAGINVLEIDVQTADCTDNQQRNRGSTRLMMLRNAFQCRAFSDAVGDSQPEPPSVPAKHGGKEHAR